MQQNDQISRGNLEYSEELYQQYLKNPSTVPEAWRWFFQGLHTGWNQTSSPSSDLDKELKVFQLFQAYRDHGSLKAKLDPLGNHTNKGFPKWSDFQITDKDLNKEFFISQHLLNLKKPLKEVLDFLEKTYCQKLALQVGACPPEVRDWFFKEFEQKNFMLSKEEKQQAFQSVANADRIEKFLHLNFLGKKRFSLEGLEALVPMLDYLLEKGVSMAMKNLVIGMSHRGRVNVLVNILKQDPRVVFSNFESPSKLNFKEEPFTQDVPYHLGFSSQRRTKQGMCSLYLAYNPSHLEAVGPVICGVSRAIQRRNQDTKMRKSVIPVLVHGDAAFCGQGTVSETLQLSKLKGYTIGGTIHIILNNQLGFTTEPEEGRSSLFASDLAKSISAPVLMANADDLTSCLRAMDIACRYRYEFGSDIFIDLIGYRKYGHNEGDEPGFTQPLLYKKIKNHSSLLNQYKEELLKDQILEANEMETRIQKLDAYWGEQLKELRKLKTPFSKKDHLGIESQMMSLSPLKTTQIPKTNLDDIFHRISTEPKGIQLHPKMKKILEKRREAIAKNQLDWAVCELAAYGSLLKEGFSVRLTGQDSKRGTFSHRHAIYYDYEKNSSVSPLKVLAKENQKEFCLYNSPLSEISVLGFEYGNSCLAPDFLTLWEAQFGDFVNAGQVLIDQFISSGEQKWLQKTDIVLLLPHGYEGQGAEHSSAYLERFLQLCSQNNMRVCYLTKASQIFHALRRQKTFLKERKPLIIMSPKSLLRHPEVVSRKEDLIHGRFEEVIWDKDISDPRDVETLILCSGKVYYELKQALSQKEHIRKKKKSALFRLEQLYPFPEPALNPALNGFPCLSKIIWFQEEPYNRGAWIFVKDHLERLLQNLGQNLKIHYKGRGPMATSAEGSEQAHKTEQDKIIKSCILSI